MRFACGKKEPCLRCGGCCIIREKAFLEPEEDLKMRKRMFERTGVLYLYSLDRYTISITHKEKAVMEREAERLGKSPVFLPKKVVYDAGRMVIMDWFLDHDVCPFLEGKNVCPIYPDRPGICKAFPGKYEDPSIGLLPHRRPAIGFEEALERSKTLIKPIEILNR